MAASDEIGALTKAFSGIGVDEKSLISILGKWHPDERKTFRRGTRDFFIEDERNFERWDDRYILQLQREFLRFKNSMVMWMMHPWERDARLLKEGLYKVQQHGLLIEISCTRSSEELLGARRAYHSLFDHSIEEDVAYHINTVHRKLLVALLSSYRYEGKRVNEEIAKGEAKILCNAIKNGDHNPVENEEVVRILSTRSKLHLHEVFKHYKEITNHSIDQDLDADFGLKATVQCLYSPATYFSEVLNEALQTEGEEHMKEAVSRIIVTRADVDIKQISDEYEQKSGISLQEKIDDVANGNYKDFLLALVARGH